MTERWFRVYDGVPDDPKVQRLSDALFRAWINLLCIASRYGGEIPGDHGLIAFALRLTVSKIDAIMFALVSETLLDKTETGYRPHNWTGRQYKSDVSTPRVQQFRERQRNVSSTVSETPPEDRVQKTETDKSISAVPALKRIPKNLLNGHQTEFDEFWLTYPKRVAKGAAAKAYLKALSRAEPSIILAGAKGYARSRNGEDAQFTKAPATWLNADCWLDEAAVIDGAAPDPDFAAALAAEAEHRKKHGEIE